MSEISNEQLNVYMRYARKRVLSFAYIYRCLHDMDDLLGLVNLYLAKAIPQLSQAQNPESYAKSIVKNTLRNQARYLQRNGRILTWANVPMDGKSFGEDCSLSDLLPDKKCSQEQIHRSLDAKVILETILQMGEPHRSILLFLSQGYTKSEMAKILEIPIETANSRKKRARAALKTRLEEAGYEI